jgi:hypothetical protein
MLGKQTVTNLLLLVIAVALLFTVAQGNLAQWSPLLATIYGEAASDTNGQTNNESEESDLFQIAERLLGYALLMWALALGVEAGVESIRMFLDPRRKVKPGPGPTDILKALNPWLPKPGIVLKEKGEAPIEPDEEKEKEEEGKKEKEETDPGPDPGWWLNEQKQALAGIVRGIGGDSSADDWDEIFQELAAKEREHQKAREKRLLQNRAISLVVGVGLAFLTGINTFQLLLGPGAKTQLGCFWYKYGGILLSAFAATAGASVWHDMLDKLRQSKEEPSPPEKD